MDYQYKVGTDSILLCPYGNRCLHGVPGESVSEPPVWLVTPAMQPQRWGPAGHVTSVYTLGCIAALSNKPEIKDKREIKWDHHDWDQAHMI